VKCDSSFVDDMDNLVYCHSSTTFVETSASETTSHLFQLPPEILHHIISFLDFPALENFRRTSQFCYTFPAAHLLNHAEETYKLALFKKEKKHVREADDFRLLHARYSGPQYPSTIPFNNIHKNIVTRADRLHCFSCYSHLDRDQFTKAQVTGRRSYGHTEATRRFCIACGFKEKKWSRATYFRGRTLPCVNCQRIAQTDVEARKLDLCSECFEARTPHLKKGSRGNEKEHLQETESILECTTGSLESWINQKEEDDNTSFPSQVEMPKRAERCIHCWMVDHSFRPALMLDHRKERLCGPCWMSRVIAASVKQNSLEFAVPQTSEPPR
jgi:F-box domain